MISLLQLVPFIQDKFFNGLTFDFAYNRGSVPNSNAEDDNNERSWLF